MKGTTTILTCSFALLLCAGGALGAEGRRDISPSEQLRQREIERLLTLREKVALREKLSLKRHHALRLMTELDAALDASGVVWLSRLSWDGSGAAMEGLSPHLGNVAGFLDKRLPKGEVFGEGEIKSGEKVSDRGREFIRFSLVVATPFDGGRRRAPVPDAPGAEERRLSRLSEEKLKGLISEAENRLMEIGRSLPLEADNPKVVGDLHRFARGSGLEIVALETGEARKGEGYWEDPLQVTLRGSFHGLTRFFERLSTYPRLATPASLILERHSQVEGRVTLDARLGLLFYHLRPSQPAAGGE